MTFNPYSPPQRIEYHRRQRNLRYVCVVIAVAVTIFLGVGNWFAKAMVMPYVFEPEFAPIQRRLPWSHWVESLGWLGGQLPFVLAAGWILAYFVSRRVALTVLIVCVPMQMLIMFKFSGIVGEAEHRWGTAVLSRSIALCGMCISGVVGVYTGGRGGPQGRSGGK